MQWRGSAGQGQTTGRFLVCFRIPTASWVAAASGGVASPSCLSGGHEFLRVYRADGALAMQKMVGELNWLGWLAADGDGKGVLRAPG
jgi:hypothetical protein